MRLQVAPEHDGDRLDVVLAGSYGSRSRAQRAIAAGTVTVDGAVATKRTVVHAGQAVDAPDEEAAEREVPVARDDAPDVPVAYEDEHLLVVDKPAGLVVHPGAGTHGPTLVDALVGRAAGGEPERPGIVHRLDRDTSGLLLVARDDETHRRLQEMIRSREVVREYLALVEGRPRTRTGTIEAAIGRDPVHRTRMAVDVEEGRHAVTHFEIEEMLPRTTLLRVTLETGRTHQIRVHLGAIGLPVAGDPDYGRGDGSGEVLGIDRQFLHARRLSFDHPMTGERHVVSSELPDDLAAALVLARGA